MKQIKKTITKAEIAAMPKVLFPGRIFVIYTESEAEKAVAYLKDQRIVGVDTETRPSFKRGTTHKVALLQISTQDTCFLFRLNRIGMPKISKSQRLSNWEAEVLSEGQKLYAATDAWACVEIYNCLTELERTGGYEITEEEPIETTVNTNGL